jgi:hypothetical protein
MTKRNDGRESLCECWQRRRVYEKNAGGKSRRKEKGDTALGGRGGRDVDDHDPRNG